MRLSSFLSVFVLLFVVGTCSTASYMLVFPMGTDVVVAQKEGDTAPPAPTPDASFAVPASDAAPASQEYEMTDDFGDDEDLVVREELSVGMNADGNIDVLVLKEGESASSEEARYSDVTIEFVDGADTVIFKGVSDDDGELLVEGIEPGTYTVNATIEDVSVSFLVTVEGQDAALETALSAEGVDGEPFVGTSTAVPIALPPQTLVLVVPQANQNQGDTQDPPAEEGIPFGGGGGGSPVGGGGGGSGGSGFGTLLGAAALAAGAAALADDNDSNRNGASQATP